MIDLRIPAPNMQPLGEDSDGKEESEYMLRWSEHNTQLINIFHQLCQDGEFTDVTLATEGDQFQAHKLVLSACSPYFRQLFLANPCKHPIVFLKDIPEAHMRLLLEYMYRGSIAVKHHQLADILRTASSLKIRGLTTALEPPTASSVTAAASTDSHRHRHASAELPATPRPLVVDENRFVPSAGGGSSSLGSGDLVEDEEEEEEEDSIAEAKFHHSSRSIPGARSHHEQILAASVAAATAADKFHHLETGSCHSTGSGRSGSGGTVGRKAEGNGRKSSAPKKLRLSSAEDKDSELRGGGWAPAGPLPLPHTAALATTLQEGTDQLRAPTPYDEEGGHISSDEDEEESGSAAVTAAVGGGDIGSPMDEEQQRAPSGQTAAGGSDDSESIIDTDQPVDFSAATGGRKRTATAIGGGLMAPRYSILGSYLKTATAATGGRLASTDEEEEGCGQLLPPSHHHFQQQLLRRPAGAADSWLNSLEQLSSMSSMLGSHMGAGRPASRDSRGESREERNTSGEDNDAKVHSPPLLPSLSDTLGIDIAGRLRSHFLANLPSQSYAWLNSMSGLAAAAPPPPALRSLGGGGRVAEEGSGRHSSGDKLDKHPVGGIRTGEVGPNGKPSVACEVCGKKLADPSSLYRHRKIHSGDKPHKCPYCPRRFIQRYNMKQHIKTHRIELLADGSKTGSELLTPHKEFHWQEQEHNLSH